MGDVLFWLHFGADLLIGLSFLAMAVLVARLLWRRRETPLAWFFWLFTLSLLVGSLTYLLEAASDLTPIPSASGLAKLFTVLVSWGTVAALCLILPRAQAMPSPAELERRIEMLRHTEERLRVSEEMFRSVAETAKDAILSADTSEKITFFNRRAERIFGWNLADALGKPLSQFLVHHPHGIRGLPSADSSTLGKPVEGVGRRRDGREFPLELTLTFVQTQGGIFMTFIIRDITDRKQAEQVLRRSRDELELRVQERTAELAHANEKLRGEIRERMGVEEVLRRRERELAASLQEKEVLLREIQHRVKNNLQVMASLHALEAEHIHDPQALSVFKESRNRIQSLALVHEMLHHVRDQARIQFLDYVRKLAINIFQSFGVAQSRIGLRIDVEPMLLELDKAIPCGLIINELLSNSLKHAFPAGRRGEVVIGLSRQASLLTLTVADNGVGMPRDLDQRRGESLGLQLVRTLTDQLDGDLRYFNAHGTLFRITFPSSAAQENETHAASTDSRRRG